MIEGRKVLGEVCLNKTTEKNKGTVKKFVG